MIVRAAAALLLGLLHAATFAPWQHWWLAIATLAALYALLIGRPGDVVATARPLDRAGLVLAFGVGWFAAGLAWLYNSMHVYGGMAAPLAAAAVVVFAIYLASFAAVATWIACRVFERAPPVALALALAGTWTLSEIARGWMLSGFPWLAIGYTQLDGPLDRLAPLGGVYAVGAAATLVAALLAAAVQTVAGSRAAGAGAGAGGTAVTVRGGAMAAACAILLLLASLAIPRGSWTEPYGNPLAVRLVQGNVEQEMKFRPERLLPTMLQYLRLIEAADEALVVLPETAWTVPWSSTPESVARRIEAHVRRGHAVSIGAPLPAVRDSGESGHGADGGDSGASGARRRNATADRAIANSVLTLLPDPAAPAGIATHRYDKQHLVPFGEFIPLGFRWFVNLMEIPLGDFARGTADQPPLEVGGQRIAFNICYEDLFGEELIRALHGERPATILANVSNIAWFGDSHALPQHLQIARMRTLETGRPMLRSTNTGVTAAIAADGTVIAQMPTYTIGALSVTVQGMAGLTPYARMGNWPAAIAALLLVAAAAGLQRGAGALGRPGGAGTGAARRHPDGAGRTRQTR
jgi:apolipoprotein N-acyltransferase